MRLFAAVLPPPGAIDELAAQVHRLRALPGADRLRWTERANWHFTLAFYGEVAEQSLPELRTRLARAAHRHQPYDVRLAGGGRFSDQVVWVGLGGDRTASRRLAESAAAGARRAGVTMDDRSYHPHLTIARQRLEKLDLAPVVTALNDFEGRVWTVDRLHLIRSNLPVRGIVGEQPRYEVVAAWPLGR